MSSWVENQQQDAFLLYRRYLGIGLHFRDGTSYDYTLYNGATRTTLQAFLKKPKPEVLKFMQLSNRLKGVNHEEFLFANARFESLSLNHLMSPVALGTYKNWKDEFGDHDSFVETVFHQFKRYSPGTPDDDEDPTRLAIALLGKGDDFIELIAWLLQTNPEIGTDVRVAAENNILLKMVLEKVIKVQKFYSYFCII